MPLPTQWREDVPNMSDAALLVSVEDLINMAMGPDDQNTVNYKLVQMILHILARQMRMLETRVEVKIAEKPVVEDVTETRKKKKRRTSSASSSSPSPPPTGRKSGKEEDAQAKTKSKKIQSKSPRGKDEDEQRARDKTGDDYKYRERTKYEADETRKKHKDKERHESRSEPGSRFGGESEKAKERIKDEQTKVKGQGKAKGRRMDENDEDETKKTGKYKDKVDSAKAKSKYARQPAESDDLEDRKKSGKQKGGTEIKGSGKRQKDEIEIKERGKRGKSEQVTPDTSDADDQREAPDEYVREKKSKDKSKAESRTPTSTAEGAESEDGDRKMEDDDDDESSESKISRKGKESKKYKSDTSALSPISENKHREDDRGKKHDEEDDREKRHGKEMYKSETKDQPTQERGESQEQAYRVEPDLLENPVNKYRRTELKEKKSAFESTNDIERYRRKHKETIDALREQFADQYIISESDEPMTIEKQTPERSKRKEPFQDRAESDDDWTKWNKKERPPKSKYKSDGDEPEKEDELRQRQDDLANDKKKTRQKESKKVLGGFQYRKRNSARDESEDGETKTRGRSKSAKQDTREVEEYATRRKERSKSARIDRAKFEEDTIGSGRRDQIDKTGILKTKRGESDDLEDDYRLTSKERKAMQDELTTDSKGRKKRERTESIHLDDEIGIAIKRRKTDTQDIQERKLRSADTFDKAVRSSESIELGTKRKKSAKRRDRIGSAKERQKAETSESEDYEGITDDKVDEGQPGMSDRERKSATATDKAESRERKKSATRKDKTDIDGLLDQRSLETIDSADLEEDYEAKSKERKKTAKEKDKTDKDKLQEQKSLETIDSADFEEDHEAEAKERKKAAKQENKTDKDADLEDNDNGTESKERRKSAKQKDKTDKSTLGAIDSEDLENEGRAESKESRKSAKQKDITDKLQEQRSLETIDSADLEEDNRAELKERKKSAKQKDKTDRDVDLEGDDQGTNKSIDRKKSAKQKNKTDKDGSEKQGKTGTFDSKDLENEGSGRKKSAKQRDKAEKDESQKQRIPGTGDLEGVEDDDVHRTESKERKKSAKEKNKTDKDTSQERGAPDTMDSAALEEDQTAERIKSAKKKANAAEKKRKSAERPETFDQETERKKAFNETDTLDSKSSKPGKLGKEEERGPKGEKVLVVEKGPTTRTDSRTKMGSIEVVTRSQFEELQSEVRDLKKKAGPLPMPAMPDNQKLRKELVRGSATLGDTMQAMQVAARVEAAEKAIGRMAGLLTQLAAAGALPEDVAYQVENVTAEMEAAAAEIQAVKKQMGGVGGTGAATGKGAGLPGTGAGAGAGGGVTGGPVNLGGWPLPLAGRKSVAIDPMTKDPRGGAPSITSRASVTSRMSKLGSLGTTWVTHNELEDALASLRDQLSKNLTNMTSRATTAAEAASAIAKAVAEKLDIALKMDVRISHLHSMVLDYSEQLSGFDVGLTTQMQSFQEQMLLMRNDLQQGLAMLASANNNAETAAVMELSERYESLVSELDHTIHAHAGLTAFQNQLGDELKSLAECVETLREQKADLEEVKDGLRDKADNSRLAGLLTETMFASSRSEMERRLDCCYDKFRKQESVWLGAVKDLTGIAEQKAEMMQLMAARDDAQHQLREIKERLGNLAIMLGEPKAALLTRQLSRNGSCGACLLPALQEPTEPAAGRPHALPAARPAPVGEEEPCAPPPCTLQPYNNREHTCLRWAGGSHTLVTDVVRRVQAEPLERGIPTSKYAGFGTDGRMYLMENELAPCIPCLECNPKSIDIMAEKVPEKYKRRFENLPGEVLKVEDGAGDGGMKQ